MVSILSFISTSPSEFSRYLLTVPRVQNTIDITSNIMFNNILQKKLLKG